MTTMMASILSETRKGLIITWDYKFSLLVDMIGTSLVFIGIVFFVGQGAISDSQVASSFVGFMVTYYAIKAIESMSWALMEEAQSGTLEQMYMSVTRGQIVIIGRLFASLVASTLQVLIIMAVLIPLLHIRLTISLDVFPVLLVTIMGLVGFGYIIGGITLVVKRIGSLENIFLTALFIANGTFLPIHLMPTWMATFAAFLPSTVGIVLLRRVTLHGHSLSDLWQDGSFIVLIGHSILFFILGWLIYALCENIAKRQGTLGHY